MTQIAGQKIGRITMLRDCGHWLVHDVFTTAKPTELGNIEQLQEGLRRVKGLIISPESPPCPVCENNKTQAQCVPGPACAS